jgi:hypothetical protein
MPDDMISATTTREYETCGNRHRVILTHQNCQIKCILPTMNAESIQYFRLKCSNQYPLSIRGSCDLVFYLQLFFVVAVIHSDPIDSARPNRRDARFCNMVVSASASYVSYLPSC